MGGGVCFKSDSNSHFSTIRNLGHVFDKHCFHLGDSEGLGTKFANDLVEKSEILINFHGFASRGVGENVDDRNHSSRC